LRTSLQSRSGNVYLEHELFDELGATFEQTALQRRLDEQAADARAEEERVSALREEHERRIEDARLAQQARQQRLQASG
jgi:hypothetical protein